MTHVEPPAESMTQTNEASGKLGIGDHFRRRWTDFGGHPGYHPAARAERRGFRSADHVTAIRRAATGYLRPGPRSPLLRGAAGRGPRRVLPRAALALPGRRPIATGCDLLRLALGGPRPAFAVGAEHECLTRSRGGFGCSAHPCPHHVAPVRRFTSRRCPSRLRLATWEALCQDPARER
jgi:hypothetical protein